MKSHEKESIHPIRQWPKVHDLCHFFCIFATVKKSTDMQELHALQKRLTKSDTSGHCQGCCTVCKHLKHSLLHCTLNLVELQPPGAEVMGLSAVVPSSVVQSIHCIEHISLGTNVDCVAVFYPDNGD